jgi:hypothetical protein
MNAKKLPSGNWRAQAFKIIDGERVRKSFTAPSKAEAEFLASEWVTRTTETKKMPTIAEVVDSYIKHREAVLSPSTTRTYISYRESNFGAFWTRCRKRRHIRTVAGIYQRTCNGKIRENG